MSDSLAGLAINVNVKSVNDAIKALDGLARKAGEVEKKVSNVNVSGASTANNRAVQEATRISREIEKVNRQQNAARKISAEQTISIERAKMNTLLSDNNRFFSAMNLAENRRLVNWQKFQDRLNRGINQEIAANKRRTDFIAAEGQRQIAATETITRRADAARERATQRINRERDREVRNAQAQARQTLAQEVALERALQASRSRLTGITGRANRQLPSVEATSIIRNATDAQRVYEQVLRSSGATSLAAVRAQGDFSRAMQNASGEIARQGGLLRTLNTNASAMNAAFGGASNTLGGFGRVIFQTNAALASLAGAFALREITQSIMEFERFSNTLRTVSGSSGEFGQNMTFLFNEANRIGFSIGEVGNSFARFSLAMQGAGFNTEQTRSSFSQLAEASRNLGLSSADTTGVIRALEQSMSKGKFMAEEVRLQLGDRLPFAMAALTRAVTTVDGRVSDINKRFEEGTLDVARYGQEFIRQLNLMSGGADALSRTSNTIAAAFGRLGTEFTKTTTYFGEAGFSNAVIIFADNLQRILVLARESGALDILADGLLKVAQNMEVLGVAIGTVAALLSARLFQVLFASITQLNPAVRAVTLAIGGLVAAYQLLSGLNNNSATSSQNFAASLSNLNTITGRVNESVQNYQNLINRGAPLTDASATAVDQHVAANMRLGDSFEVAARKAGEAYAEINRLATEQARREQEIAERNLRSFLAGQSTIQNFGRASRIREAEARSGFRLQSGQETTNPGLTVGQDDFVNSALQDFVNLRRTFQETVDSIRSEFGQNIPASVQRLLESLARLEGNKTFITMRDQVRVAGQALTAVEGQLDRMTQSEYIIRLTADTVALQGFDTPRRNGGPSLTELETSTADSVRAAGSPRTRIAAFQSSIMSGPLSSSFSGLDVTSGRDADIVRRIASNPDVRRLLPGVARAFTETSASGRTAGGGTTNRVQEAMRDLGLQSSRAGLENGTAETALAEALKRVADAANLAIEAFEQSADAAEVRRLVANRLNKELDLSIRLMARETTNNNRVAQAYLRSNEAGRAMETTIRAEAEARKAGIPGTAQYEEALRRITQAMNEQTTSAQNLALARQMSEGRNEIEVLELEGRLITSNTGARNAEIAVLRMRQQFVGAGETELAQMEQQIRRTEELRTRNEQLTNSWTEVSRLGEQAFERIGSAITEALAQGKIEGISFKNVMKAVFSEVAQAALKLAVINPILNSLFGGTRGTLSGALSASGLGGGGFGGLSLLGGLTGATDSGGGLTDTSSLDISGATNKAAQSAGLLSFGRSTGLGQAFTGGSAASGYGPLDSLLNTNLWGNTGNGVIVGAADGATNALTGATTYAPGSLPGGLNIGGAIGGAAGIAGGAYGIYSGLQKGGIGGGLQVAGGALSAGLGAAALAGLSLGPPGWIAAAALAIAGALLPGEKPSGMGQLARTNLNSGAESFEGLGGKRFSQGNRDNASNSVDNIVKLAEEIGDKLGGARIGGDVAVGVTNDKLYIDVNGQKANFANTAEGAKQLAETAARMVVNEFAGQGSVQGDYRGIVAAAGGSVEKLDQDLRWYDEVYSAFKDTTDEADKVARAVKGVEDKFAPLIVKAKELGLATDDIIAAREKEIEVTRRNVTEAERQRVAEISAIKAGLDYREALVKGSIDYESILLVGQINTAKAWADELVGLEQRLYELGETTENVALATSRLKKIQGDEFWANFVNSMAELDNSVTGRILRANGRSGAADRIDFEIAATNQIKELTVALAGLGLSADIAAIKIAETQQAIDAERAARERAANDQIVALDQSVIGRILRATGRGNEADIYDFENAAALELKNLAQNLDNLGFSAEVVSKKIVETEQAIAAERLALQNRFAEEAAEAQRAAIEQILTIGQSIRGYLNDKNTSSAPGGVSTLEALTNAKSIFGNELTLARGGDVDALGRITSTADRLLEAAGNQYGNTVDYNAIRSFVLASLETLPAVKSYDQLMYEEIQKLGGAVNVEVGVTMIRAITESLNALPDAERNRLIAEGEVQRRILQAVEAATGMPLLTPGVITRSVTQAVETTETVQISRSIDDKLSSILNASLVIGREQVKILGQINSDTNLLWKAAAGVNQPGIRVNSSDWSHQSTSNIVKFAKGGIVDAPMSFSMAGGRMGLMGEAGTEAIMPTVRMANGDFGVQASVSGSSENSERLLERLVWEIATLRENVDDLIESGERTANATENTAASNARMAQREMVAGARTRAS